MKIYPPNEKYPYRHYKHGLRAWSDTPVIERVALVVSIIALIASCRH